MRRSFLLLAVSALLAGPARADDGLPPPLRDVGIDQRLGEQVPLDLPFRDEDERMVRLGDYFHGKPVILVLAYFRCPMLCNQVLNGLVDGIRGVPFDAGKEFQVVVVSFDTRETPQLAAAKKKNYADDYGRPHADEGWHFLTGRQGSIDRIAKAVGFRYHYDEEKDQFAHASGIMVLTPQGKLARYFYGIKYDSRDLRLGLVEASENRIGSPVDRVLLFCYHYDPNTGKYTPVVMNFVRLASALTVLVLGLSLFVAWRHELRKGRRQAPNPGPPVATGGPAGPQELSPSLGGDGSG